MPDDTDDGPRSDIDYRPNGGIHLWVDGTKHRLRSPRLRDYRYLVDIWREANDELSDMLAEHTTWLDGVLAAHEGNPEASFTPEERVRDRQFGRDNEDRTGQAVTGWWQAVIERLADEKIAEDDLPPFCSNMETVAEAIGHWRSVPSRSGVR